MGRDLDVAVDSLQSRATFGQRVGILLSDNNKRRLLILRGFARRFPISSARVERAKLKVMK
ncbi:dTDP-4-dehydrorhamnose 3,5-epimerase family protein [Rhizobium sp. NPDC090279]|uniref:dTDP-4-dehydrorhamnose 3,5-epimerase family protein n=1 Tax=Rhizobium sp. NPDC090279 TaxID=3364499 RepID=UPI003839D9AD